jgi:excisionase family DNA binding protein
MSKINAGTNPLQEHSSPTDPVRDIYHTLIKKLERVEAEIQALRTKQERLVIPREEAADMLSISLSKLDQMIEAGEIASYKIGRRRVIDREALRDYHAKRLQGA